VTQPFRDPTLPLRERALDLLGRLDRTERIALLHQFSPGVERLGLAPFRTGTEGLHGVAWLGTATVFPQPVGLAATWDTDLLRRIGDAVATEVRAKHAADATVSLNVWAPVVNPLRHPRWGRTEEGWSEDGHLTALLAGAYAAGLRGDHPRVWKTVPTLKHFLGYGHETDRAVTSSHLTLRTLHEQELPAYRGPVEAGVVGAVMPAYNLVDGRPCHVSGELIDALRRWSTTSLEGSLAVVSDAAAPTNLVTGERYFPDHVASHAAALAAGVDSFTDNDADAGPTVERLTAALARGLVTETDVDRAVLRLLELRLRTGELDGDADPYATVGPEQVDLPAHRALAREASARAVVVLRNTGPLPLGRKAAPARVAVVGPLADRVLTDWYSGTPPYGVDLAGALRERWPGAEVSVATGADVVALRSTTAHAYLTVAEDGDPVLVASSPDASEGTHLEVTDWGDGLLTLRARANDRLLTGAGWIVRAAATRVGGWVAQESFRRHHHPDGTWSLQHAGSGRWLRVQHGSGLLVAEAPSPDDAERFSCRTIRSGHADVAAAAARADAVVVAVGNDPHLAGRETEDRPHLRLPDAALEVWRAAREAHDDAVLALVSSYPYVLGPETDDARAVVWSSHGGQELGHGLADVLAGDVEPTGRLTQTWPAAEADPGELLDHDLAAQHATYRYADAEPAFALGHGLTYSTVAYGGLRLDRPDVDAPDPTQVHPAYGHVPPAGRALRATVTVRNTGSRPAHELVQLYALAAGLPIPAPRRLLLAHARVVLAPGEEREVPLVADVDRLAVWDVAAHVPGAPADWVHTGALRVQPGTYVLAAGPSAAELPARCRLTVHGAGARVRRPADEVVPGHAFHTGRGVVVGDLSRESGACVETPAGAAVPGVVRYDGVDLAGCSVLRLRVAATRAAPVPLTPAWRPAGDGSAPWLPLGSAATPTPGRTDARYDWHEVTITLDDVPTGPVDLRIALAPGTRLAAISG
jgi:beta-glucosidase